MRWVRWGSVAVFAWALVAAGCFEAAKYLYLDEPEMPAATGVTAGESWVLEGTLGPMSQTATAPGFRLEGTFGLSASGVKK